MKITTTIITTLFFCFFLLSCGHGSKDKLKDNELRANGHYWIEGFTLEGDCENPPAFELIVWNNTVYDNQETAPFDVAGELLRNFEIKALATLEDGTLVEIEGMLLEFTSISGDWEFLDGSCNGYLTGERMEL